MTDNAKAMTREQRLAARLRDNLRRRKAQARALESAPDGPDRGPSQTPPEQLGRGAPDEGA